MIVAHIIGSNCFGGPERQILTHALRVRERGIEPRIISFSENGNPSELLVRAKEHGITCMELSQRSPFHPGSVAELAGQLKSGRVQLLVAHGYKANVIGRLATRWAGIPLLAVSRGWTAESFRIRCYEWIDRLFLRWADHVVAVSEGQKRKVLATGVKAEKVSVIHNCVDLEEFPGPLSTGLRGELGIPQDSLIVASAGRLSPEKNHLGLIEVAARICPSHPEIRFVVFGEGFLRPTLEQAIRRAGLEGRFLLPGFRKDLRALLHDIDVFVLPSFTEGLPNVILEAFACRKPVVATAVGGTPEVVTDKVNGFLTPVSQPQYLYESIMMLVDSDAKRVAMGHMGFEKVKNDFGFSTQTEYYLSLYNKFGDNRK